MRRINQTYIIQTKGSAKGVQLDTSLLTSVDRNLIVPNADGTIALTQRTVVPVSGTYPITTTDELILCNGTFTVTLPTAVGVIGKEYTIKNVGTGVITLDTTSSQTIDGQTSLTIDIQYVSITVVSDGSNWVIV